MNTTFSKLIGIVGMAAMAQSAHAELKWEQTSIDLQPAIGDKQAVAHFKYENVGKTPVHFKSVHASCGCTTAQTQKEEVAPGSSPNEFRISIQPKDTTKPSYTTLTIKPDSPANAPNVFAASARVLPPVPSPGSTPGTQAQLPVMRRAIAPPIPAATASPS